MSEEVEEKPSNHKVVVKRGFLVYVVGFSTVKWITIFLSCALMGALFYSVKLFISAVQIRTHLGYFINMISSGDGDILPSLQAVPVLIFLISNIIMGFTVYTAFDDLERPDLNRFMFLMFLINFVLLIVMLIIIISVIAHAYGAHETLHDGIVTAMKNYSTSVKYKSQIDRLQIEFQCCGSKKYDEWYTIKWFDASLEQGSGGSAADGNTPFSCCSMKSLFPCIHHNIEITGKAYLYTPEYNLSISTRGCYEILREKKQKVGWAIVGNLFLFLLIQGFATGMYRFIQTAHFANFRFVGHNQMYTIWIFGSYIGKVKKDPSEDKLVPDELKD